MPSRCHPAHALARRARRRRAQSARPLAALLGAASALGLGAGLAPAVGVALAPRATPAQGGAEAPGQAGGTQPATAPASGPCATTALRLRCPDLVMSAPSALHLDRSTRLGRVLLRATSSINNHGSGPLELRARRSGNATVVYQAIYDRAGRVHLARTRAKLVYKFIPGERYEHEAVGAFSYWKLEHAAAFQLWSLDASLHALRLVRSGPKIDYCLRDLRRTRPSPRSPASAVYPACSQEANMRRDVLGTSVGWSDVYPYEYPAQWIDVTGLRGRFAYVQLADPEGLLAESDHRNDLSETYVSLPSGRVIGHRVGVSGP